MTYLVCDMYIFLTSYQVHVLMQFNVSFQVFNLSERRYDISKLNHQVSNNNNNFFTWKMLPSGKVLYGMLLVETDYFVFNFCTGVGFWLA